MWDSNYNWEMVKSLSLRPCWMLWIMKSHFSLQVIRHVAQKSSCCVQWNCRELSKKQNICILMWSEINTSFEHSTILTLCTFDFALDLIYFYQISCFIFPLWNTKVLHSISVLAIETNWVKKSQKGVHSINGKVSCLLCNCKSHASLRKKFHIRIIYVSRWQLNILRLALLQPNTRWQS